MADEVADCRVSFALVNEDADAGCLPEDAKWLTFSFSLDPEAGKTIRTDAYPVPDKGGKYRVYFMNASTYSDITPEDPVYVNVIETPGNSILLMDKPSNEYITAADRELKVSLMPYVIGKGTDAVQLWAYNENENKNKDGAFLVFTAENISFKSKYPRTISGSPKIFEEKPYGKYIYWLKYKSDDGWQDMLGPNSGIINFAVPGRSSDVIELTASPVIGDKDCYAPADEVDVEFRLKAHKDLNIGNNTILDLCIRDEENRESLVGLEMMKWPTFSSGDVKRDEEFTVKGRYKIPADLDCGVGRTYRIGLSLSRGALSGGVSVPEEYFRIYPYNDSMKIWIGPKGSGVDGMAADDAALRVVGRTLTVSGAETGSLVEVYDMVGMRMLSHRVASAEEQIGLEALQPGVYVARAVCGGSARTLKFALR